MVSTLYVISWPASWLNTFNNVMKWCTNMGLANIIIHILADTDNRSDVHTSLKSTWIWQNVYFKNTLSGLHFMKTVPSWSFKIIGKIITDNRYWKMWPIKLISDYQPIIGIMYCAFFLCKLVMRRTSQQSTTHVNMSRKNLEADHL